jgi:NADPH-ferrihemoprotein reductase
VQERVALARRAIEKSGPDALNDWAPIYLFYGCRKSDEDFLYKDEWPRYADELKGKLNMHVAFSRQDRKPDGSELGECFSAKGMWADAIGKVYVQDLIWDNRAALAPLILEKRAYVYICGDAKSMSKAVEERLVHLLAEAKGGKPEVEGAKELKLLKDRNVSGFIFPRQVGA